MEIRLLHTHGKQSVSLYVGLSLGGARHVYARVGYQGIERPAEGCENWIEYGFNPAQVTIGYW
jgi:predicted HD phosphohydrolase